MKTKAIKFSKIPAWAINEPSVSNLFSALCLAGREGQWIRLSADTQRRLIGRNLFGMASLRSDGHQIMVSVSCCFGTDSLAGTYDAADLQAAIANDQKISPKYSGHGYYSRPERDDR